MKRRTFVMFIVGSGCLLLGVMMTLRSKSHFVDSELGAQIAFTGTTIFGGPFPPINLTIDYPSSMVLSGSGVVTATYYASLFESRLPIEAVLRNAAFSIDPNSEQPQQLRDLDTVWWSVTPNKTGTHKLILNVTGMKPGAAYYVYRGVNYHGTAVSHVNDHGTATVELPINVIEDRKTLLLYWLGVGGSVVGVLVLVVMVMVLDLWFSHLRSTRQPDVAGG